MNYNTNYERFISPRPETPEPGSRQGHRNAASGIQLLDEEGQLSDQFEACLGHIFSKYCTPRLAHVENTEKGPILMTPPPGAYFTEAGLDAWARDTNGAPFSEETKEELRQFLDVTDDGNLTFSGFIQIYRLQTENEEEETWRDLSTHGFDRTLTLVASRREDFEDSNSTL
ncbi:hypothetical protein OE88DRAFT_1710720 [Heliocybe sulcata]|uniref:EF-hand domain-containing protein n=1 Tax=Heliocybe sulcata TaxID=5364 RepID=A0A5C3NAZ2_9AGAM|nr:hypothetical protein OE88DRAFT_1710720 [Heliocybe sulcata]